MGCFWPEVPCSRNTTSRLHTWKALTSIHWSARCCRLNARNVTGRSKGSKNSCDTSTGYTWSRLRSKKSSASRAKLDVDRLGTCSLTPFSGFVLSSSHITSSNSQGCQSDRKSLPYTCQLTELMTSWQLQMFIYLYILYENLALSQP